MFTSLIICTIGVWLPYSPFAHALGFTPLPALYWPIVAALLIGYLVLTHSMKRWFHRRFGVD
jgi:Mg2+-importing ATPase